MNIEEQIINILVKNPNMMALDIATMLAEVYGRIVSKTEVNSLLYGKLRKRVTKDKDYRWRLVNDTDKIQDIRVNKVMLASPKAESLLCCDELVDFNKLLASVKPYYLISDELWNQWVTSLRKNDVRFTKIYEIADSLNLFWPDGKRDEEVCYYLNLDLLDLFEIPDVQLKKTLFLCIADAAINRTNVGANKSRKVVLDNNEIYHEKNIALDLFNVNNDKVPKHISTKLLKELKVAVKPENLITDLIWKDWSRALIDKPFAHEIINKVARHNGLVWLNSRQDDIFLNYLSRPFSEVKVILGSGNKRSLILCVAQAVLEIQTKHEAYVPRTAEPRAEIATIKFKQQSEITFEDIYKQKDPLDLITDEIWDNWTKSLINHPLSLRKISDIVDQTAGLYWKKLWEKEIIDDYLHFKLEHIRNIQWAGKNRTIIVSVAKSYFEIENYYGKDKQMRTNNDQHKFKYEITDVYVNATQRHSKISEQEPENNARKMSKSNLLETILKDFF